MSASFLRSCVLARVALLFVLSSTASAQSVATPDSDANNSSTGVAISSTATTVDVTPDSHDEQIARRLTNILNATRWFEEVSVRADQGIVFLEGSTREERYREWAGDLAGRTRDVVAVVNRIDLAHRSWTDWAPATQGLQSSWSDFLRHAPLLLVGLLCIAAAYCAGRALSWALRRSFRRNGRADLVRDLTARGAGLLIFTFGVYIALRVAGLTRVAATILGGTGVAGLVLGIAFRDIAENTLASILLTRQRPFQRGDLVEIGGIEGIVQRLTVRATVLMSLDGNHVQIPNSTVYKSAIRNFTSNPMRRIDFTVGIGYADSIAHAQDVALTVIGQHPAVLATPEPWVLAEALESSVVQLRVYVWLDGSKYAWLKVRSSVLRLVKRAFQEHGISMPDDAREVVFPEGVPVHIVSGAPLEQSDDERRPERPEAPASTSDDTSMATHAEAGLATDERHIAALAQGSRSPEAGKDLLASTP